jgi:hypothetical protein
VAAGTTHRFFVKAQNDSVDDDRFTVKGTTTGSPGITVRYYVGGVDKTAQIVSGNTYITRNLNGGSSVTIEVRVTASANAPANASKSVLVTVRSVDKPGQFDVVRAITSR